jgi:lipase maturation factor
VKGSYWLTRFIFLRWIGLIYLVAFLVAFHQYIPLLGKNGISPVQDFLDAAFQFYRSHGKASWQVPTLFWLNASDSFIQAMAGAGVALSLLVLLGGANVIILFLLWVFYQSLVNAGQLFYGYGWETMVLEAGFLAMFLPPPLNLRPFPERTPPSPIVIVLLRWMLFRVMFGAGLIKIRGDPCWRNLTCLDYHFETQPVPNPLSWYFHHLPPAVLKGGVLFNHAAELIAPWMIFGPRRVRQIGAGVILVFQFTLILSGNLSWLNYLTVALCVACFDDEALKCFFPRSVRNRVGELQGTAMFSPLRRGVTYALAGLVILLSIPPTLNLISPGQAMNASYDPLHLVNTYGAFGSVTRIRREIILEGSSDDVLDERSRWRAYEFKCKPGDPHRRPCLVSPYHFRLDWQMWFAAMEDYGENPWLLSLIEKLLQGDAALLKLMGGNPFPEKPPKFIRATLYEYHFTKPQDGSRDWWTREEIGPYLPTLTLKEGVLSIAPLKS